MYSIGQFSEAVTLVIVQDVSDFNFVPPDPTLLTISKFCQALLILSLQKSAFLMPSASGSNVYVSTPAFICRS